MKSKTVIVLGMHRSGTSMVSGILHILGVNMGQGLEDDKYFNITGHFEDKTVVRLNKKILKKNKSSWDKPKKNIKISKDTESEIQNYCSKEGLWGWKDPRTVLTYEHFAKYTKNEHLIVCFRNPLEVARSLKERDDMSIFKGLKFYNTYNGKILSIIKNKEKILLISFAELVNHPLEIATNISKLLDINVSKKQKKLIKNFIKTPKQIQQSKRLNIKEEQKKIIRENLSLKNIIDEIHGSRGWKFISFVHEIRMKLPFK